jgi:hypothetical protein
MSDVSQGPGWWLASDGRWYAPEQHPNDAPPPPPQPTPRPFSDAEFHRQSLLDQGYWKDHEGALHPPSDVAAAVLSDEEQADESSDPTEGEDGYWQDVDGNWWPPEVPPEPARISGMAIASLVLGLVPVVPFVGSILAIVFGVVARSQISQAAGRLRGAVMAAWGIALGILTLAGTVILIAVLVASAANPASSGTPSSAKAPLSVVDQKYQGDYNLGETEYHANVTYAASGITPQTTAKQACSGSGNAGQVQACTDGFNDAIAVNGPVPRATNLYQKGYDEGVSAAQQEQRTAAQGGIPNTPQGDCVTGVGPANMMPTTLTREEQGCVDGFNATYPNEYDNSTTTTSTTIAPSTLDYNTGYSMGVGLAASLPGESASVACAGLGDMVQGCEAGFNAGR